MERKNRESFRELLAEWTKLGQLNHKSKWKDLI